ncbi:MAG: YkvA family protein [Suilimivivens sp.]
MKVNLRKRAEQLKKDVPTVFLALGDKETPLIAKIFAGMTVIYALSPVDLIPDFVPVLGYLDDVILLPLLITLTIRLIPADKLEECRLRTEGMWSDGKPKKWYYAIPIVAIWLLIVLFLVKMML